jgi:hypothetical protein
MGLQHERRRVARRRPIVVDLNLFVGDEAARVMERALIGPERLDGGVFADCRELAPGERHEFHIVGKNRLEILSGPVHRGHGHSGS